MDHREHVRELQLARFREMTPAERWKAAHRLYWSARRMKAAWIAHENPDWTKHQVEAAVRDSFMHARS